MHPIRRVLGHIYFFAGMLLFLLTMLPALIPAGISLLLSEPARARLLHPAYKVWMSVFFPLVGCRVERRGRDVFKDGRNYVVVVNHNSLVDIPVSMPWIPGPNKTLAKVEMARIPLFGLIYRAGSILVDRNNEKSRKESFNQMQDTLRLGLHLCLYPEGTRNKSTEPIGTFYDGAFITAIRAQKPIIPALLFGTKAILPGKPACWAWPGKIRFHFLEPVPTEGLGIRDRHQLREYVHTQMREYFEAHREEGRHDQYITP